MNGNLYEVILEKITESDLKLKANCLKLNPKKLKNTLLI